MSASPVVKTGEEAKYHLIQKNISKVDLGEGSALPVGVPVPWPSATPPTGWLKCNGAPFSAEEYPELAKAYPTNKLPDLRGEFIRGWDDGRNIDSGRIILTAQDGTLIGYDPIRADDGLVGALGVNSASNYTDMRGDRLNNTIDSVSHIFVSMTSGTIQRRSLGADTAVISRPRNIAFNYIVRAA
ncbi:phage tail protein [Escherichia coli]|uniref:phage tail protein n=1 Tax=Escherichia coli TaxID=562 RepID=UPI000CD53EB3|nr:phage tail protein [Escherichia coli]EIW4451419.1 tail fiber protein [Escherichia coli]EIW4478604.1 tail fiber protein [Escherichia coli]EIW4600874.1 tail fiber protein [Escherichia coli]EKJ6182665.1 tail fiber protein [Escherichia coli]MBT9233166.1 phage tail protein [Escherichia coli]